MKTHKCIFFILLLLFCAVARAQYNAPQNNIWIFSLNARVDFNSGSPVVGGVSPAYSLEGGANVCDRFGNLLFYTNGDTVFNKLGVPMPNGSNIVPFETWSCTQSSVIVPFISDTSKYYIFSMEHEISGGGPRCSLAYSIVDMSMDGGLGDLLPGATGIHIEDSLAEKMIAVPGNNCNVWLVTHKRDTPKFYVYEITTAGISLPTIYNIGTYSGDNAYSYGGIRISPDRRTLFLAVNIFQTGLELYDFDPATGAISNCRSLSTTQGAYAGEFSPDNSKLYVSTLDTNGILQYDLSLPSLSAIRSSRLRLPLPPLASASDIKLGPDGKIYAGRGYFLSCITNPNVAGLGCGYVDNYLSIGSTFSLMGLPNLVWATAAMPVISGPTILCAGTAHTYTVSVTGGTWASADPAILSIDSITGNATPHLTGSTTIYYHGIGGCIAQQDVTVNPYPTPLPDFGSLCEGRTLVYSNPISGGMWSVSDTSFASIDLTTGVAIGIAPGTTTLTYAIGPCYVTQTLYVYPSPPYITGPSSVCIKDTVMLTNTMVGGVWSSSNMTLALVNGISGAVVGVGSGMATITYTAPVASCNVTHNIEVVECQLGISNSTRQQQFQLFPVPAKTEVFVRSSVALNLGTLLEVCDVVGRCLLSYPISGTFFSISVTTLPPGSYQCRIVEEGKTIWRQTLIVNH